MTVRGPVSRQADKVIHETIMDGKVPVLLVMNHETYGKYLDELVGYTKLPDQAAHTASVEVKFKVTKDYIIPVEPSSTPPRGNVWCQWREPEEGEVVTVG